MSYPGEEIEELMAPPGASEGSLQLGRRATPFTQTPDWVLLSDATAQAKCLYGHLTMHINQRRGDRIAWPGRKVLARRLSLKKVDSVDRYITELVKLGAIDKEKNRLHNGGWGHNIYTVHETPPPGYAAPTTIKEAYIREREEDAAAAAADAVSAGQPLPPEKGGGRSSTPTPQKGGRCPGKEGQPYPRFEGSNKTKSQQDEKNQTPSGGVPLRSTPPTGGRASAAPTPEPPNEHDDGQTGGALFDVAASKPTGNDLSHPTKDVGRASGAGRKPRGGGGRRKRVGFPDGWQPSPAAVASAREKCPLLDDERLRVEVDRCVNWAQANGKTYVDHDRMWLNWVLGEQAKARERQDRYERGPGARPGRQGGSYGGAAELYRDADTWGTEDRDVSSWENFNTNPMDDTPMTEAEVQALFEEGDRRHEAAQEKQRREAREAWRGGWDTNTWNATGREAG